MGIDDGFWRGRRVLVTGHTGFKGSWLTLWLGSLGAQVTGYSMRRREEPCLYVLADVREGIEERWGDTRDAGALRDALAAAEPEIVLHLAAQPIVRRSYREPVETFETNVMGTVNVLEAARAGGGVRAIVNVTTDKVYDNRGWEWPYREPEPLGGADPYSASKACSELVTAAYRSSFFSGDDGHGANVATARAGNVIGGGDFAEDRLVPDVMRAAVAGDRVVIRKPHAMRPWQHVLNPLAGYLLLAQQLFESDEPADAWNFGPDDADALPVGRLVDLLAELWPGGIERDYGDEGGPHEAPTLKLDSSRAHHRLGWRPRWDLERGLRAVVEWHTAHRDGGDVRAVVLHQIAAYQSGN